MAPGALPLAFVVGCIVQNPTVATNELTLVATNDIFRDVCGRNLYLLLVPESPSTASAIPNVVSR